LVKIVRINKEFTRFLTFDGSGKENQRIELLNGGDPPIGESSQIQLFRYLKGLIKGHFISHALLPG
jgi:hypothetical protein